VHNTIKYILSSVVASCLILVCCCNTVLANEKKPEKSQQTLQGRAVVIDLNSDKLDYYPEENQFVATGNAEVVIKEKNSRLKAEKIIFNQDTQIITAEGDVRLLKDGAVIKGDFLKVDLNNENAIIDKPQTKIDVININAETANIYGDKIDALKGNAVINEKMNLILSSNEFGGFEKPDKTEAETHAKTTNKPLNAIRKSNYRITTKEIIVKADKYRNIIKIKNANIYIGKVKIAYVPSLEISTDKELSQIETMLPEMGHTQQMGYYGGPSHVFHLPFGTTFKVSPLFAFDGGDIGAGGFARLTTSFNKTEMGYTSVKKKFVVRGEQAFLTPNTKIVYGSNSYMSDGFLGERLPAYAIEMVDDRTYLIEDLNLYYNNRFSAGYAQDCDRDWGTARFKLQGDFITNKPLLQYKDYLKLRLQSQYDFTVYGDGSTFGILRSGPKIDAKLGPLKTSVVYFQGGIHGDSPFNYDKYYYGKSNLVLHNDLKIYKYLNVGYIGSFNIKKDNFDNRFLAENQLYFRVGPEDFKVRLGYDSVRERTLFGLDLLVGSERTALEFDKAKIINPGELNKQKTTKHKYKKTRFTEKTDI